ncbi:uncharacterized protein A4U43_C03F19300 [Asparagus officinalis]|uniref:Carbonic anhydrase n=1 Tax=Asparagus officinalis TaxID=4686 RepID=A0A5P1FFM2_ASPOF|nr:alpha carbonic anhydrase 7-like [Asparagus officinalis]ONK75669.1 uncharacterized protein A4U43_C03F19300 [Asparagus officinalis]
MALQNLVAISFAFALLLSNPMLTKSQEVEDEREFSYVTGTENGPEHWGEIHKEWSECGKGEMQSPIDLHHQRVQVLDYLGPLTRKYQPADAVMVNRGHDISVKWEEGAAGGILLNGTEYFLRQLHWHAPSEHSINGVRYSLELHMVHQSADKKIAVVGIMYKIGRPDPLLAKMEHYITMLKDAEGEEEKLGMIDPEDVKWGSRKYYRYMGSLTTPPCTEGVMWTIIKKVRTVSREQIHLLREAVHDESQMNARPKQEINDRVIGLYRPRKVRY